MKYYTISQRNISPRPRSKRLQASGQAASGATAMTVLAGSGTASHIHANKAVLDRLGADAEGYLTLSTLSENTDPNTGDTVWQETDEKVKAGQADVARALAPDSPTFGVIEQRGDQRYVRMDFLNRLLQAHNGQNNVSPNDLTTQITDIEALFSLWTRGSLTALGRGSNASAGSGLDSEMLWSLLQDNYDGVHHIDSRYINFPTVDLSAYATQTWVAQQGYLTQHQSLSHLLPLAGGTLTGTLYTQTVTPVADNAYSLGIGGRRWSDLRTVKATVSGDLGVGGKVNAWGNIVPMPTTANGTTTYPQLGTGSQRWSNVVAVNLNSSGTAQLTDIRGTTARLTGAVTADSFVKTGGTGSQFLKADGSTDSTTYLPLYGGYLTGDLYTHSLLPYADNLYNLGDGLHRWASLRAVTANVSEDLGVGGRLLAYGDIVPMPTTDEETNETTWPQLGRADNRWSQVVTWRLNVADGAVLGLLQVNGSATMMSGLYVPTGQALRIGDAVLRYDSATGSLYVTKHDGTPAHFYATGGVSALGSNASAGSGTGGIDAAMLWSLLQDNYDGVHHIDSRYINFPTVDLSAYATQTWVAQQGYLTQHQSLAAYATQTWVTQQGYLTQHQSLAAYALKTELPTTMAWTAITGKPSTFTPSTHTHTKSQITDFAHTHTKSQITDFPSTWAWGSITGKPTTLSGYGITDAYTKAQADARYLRKDVGGFIDGELSLQGRNFGFVDGLFFNWLPAAEEITFDDYPALSDYLTYDAESKDSATVMEGTGQLFIANDVVLRDLCDGSYRNLTTGGITAYGHIAPPVSNSYNCGTPSCAWGNVFTAYLRSRPNTKLYIGAAGSVHIGITTGGNVTIGNSTTDLGYKLGVNGTFRAAGNASLGGTLTVARATTLSNTLAVTGATTLRSTLNVTGTTQLNNTLTLNNRLEMINLVTSDDESDPRVQICVDGDGLNIFDNTEGQDLLHVLYVVGQSYFTGKVEIENQLEVDGLISSYTGIYSRGYVSALGQNTSSDSRLKNILDCEAMPPIEAIAAAPAIHYTWKNRPGMGRQAGSTAQYWQKVVPECVSQGTDGMLSMQYGVIALLSAISLAQTAQDHERRLQRLETLKPSNPLNS